VLSLFGGGEAEHVCFRDPTVVRESPNLDDLKAVPPLMREQKKRREEEEEGERKRGGC